MAASVLPLFLFAAARTKFLFREINLIEHPARIFRLTRAAFALLGRHACIICRHEKLCIPFQTNDRELTQRDKELLDVAAQNQVFIKHASQTLRNIVVTAAAFTAAVRLNDLRRQNDRIERLHNRTRHIALLNRALIHSLGTALRRKGADFSLTAEQNCPLIKDRQTTDIRHTAASGIDLRKHTIEKPCVHTEKATVKINRRNIQFDPQQFCAARLYRIRAVEQLL